MWDGKEQAGIGTPFLCARGALHAACVCACVCVCAKSSIAAALATASATGPRTAPGKKKQAFALCTSHFIHFCPNCCPAEHKPLCDILQVLGSRVKGCHQGTEACNFALMPMPPLQPFTRLPLFLPPSTMCPLAFFAMTFPPPCTTSSCLTLPLLLAHPRSKPTGKYYGPEIAMTVSSVPFPPF